MSAGTEELLFPCRKLLPRLELNSRHRSIWVVVGQLLYGFYYPGLAPRYFRKWSQTLSVCIFSCPTLRLMLTSGRDMQLHITYKTFSAMVMAMVGF